MLDGLNRAKIEFVRLKEYSMLAEIWKYSVNFKASLRALT